MMYTLPGHGENNIQGTYLHSDLLGEMGDKGGCQNGGQRTPWGGSNYVHWTWEGKGGHETWSEKAHTAIKEG